MLRLTHEVDFLNSIMKLIAKLHYTCISSVCIEVAAQTFSNASQFIIDYLPLYLNDKIDLLRDKYY